MAQKRAWDGTVKISVVTRAAFGTCISGGSEENDPYMIEFRLGERNDHMKRAIGWMGIVALGAIFMMGCGKKDTQVVTPGQLKTDEVAVWVDQTGITQGQIQREAARLFSHVPQDTPTEQVPQVQARILGQAIDNLVMRQLVKAEMDRSGVLISRAELDQGKLELEKGLGEGNSLVMLLAAANLSMEDLENNLRLDLFKNKVVKDQVDAAQAAITDDVVRKFYDEHLDEFTIPEGRTVSHILIRVATGADESIKMDARAKAEGVRKALLEGADFEALAREVSQCASRSRGGALGVIPRGREAPAFEEAVFSQGIGEIGEVVESPVGFHVIRVDGEQEEKVIPYEEVQNRLRLQMRAKAQTDINNAYIRDLRENAVIKLEGELAKASAAAEAAEAAEEELDAGDAAVTAPEAAVDAESAVTLP